MDSGQAHCSVSTLAPRACGRCFVSVVHILLEADLGNGIIDLWTGK